jgi:hypothetical protein
VTVYTLTARIISPGGEVIAVKQAPFHVMDGAEADLTAALTALLKAEADIEEAAGDLLAAALDEAHPKHHWWRRQA